MKNLLFLLLIVLFCLGCNNKEKVVDNQKIVQNLIKDYMNENLKDPTSYEVIEPGTLDSVFYTPNGIYYVKNELLNTYEFSHTNIYFKDDIGERFIKTLSDPEFVGYTITHKYKAKNSYGNYNSSEKTFYLPVDLTRLWDENIHLPNYFEKLPKKWTFTEEEKNNIMSLIEVDKDEYNDVTWFYSKKREKYNVGKNTINMYAGLVNESPSLRLQVYYTSSSWLFFDKIDILYDGTPMQIHFERKNKETETLYGGKIAEYIDVYIDSYVMIDKLEKLAQSETAKIKLTGKKYYDERTITAKEKSIIQEVINCYKVLDFEN